MWYKPSVTTTESSSFIAGNSTFPILVCNSLRVASGERRRTGQIPGRTGGETEDRTLLVDPNRSREADGDVGLPPADLRTQHSWSERRHDGDPDAVLEELTEAERRDRKEEF
jgi:hypothetical protein